jgi:DNA repair ATPase RecN
MKIKQHWAEIAEYSSLVGLVLALIYRQIAAAPFLSIFIWLNLKNRRHLEAATNAAVQNAVQPRFEQLNTTISSKLQFLSQGQAEAIEFKEFTSDELEHVKTELDRIIEAQAIKDKTVQGQLTQLSQVLENLQSELERQPEPFDPTPIEQKTEALIQQVQKVEQQVSPLIKPEFIRLIRSIYTKTELLQQHVQSFVTAQHFDEWQQNNFNSIKSEIEHLTSKVDGLSDRLGVQLVQEMKADLGELENQIKSIRQDTSSIQNEYAVLRERTEALESINQKVQSLENNFEQLSKELQILRSLPDTFVELNQKFDNVKQYISSLDASSLKLQKQIHHLDPINEQVQNLKVAFEQLNERTAALEGTKESLMDLEKQFGDLDASYEKLHDRTRNIDQLEDKVGRSIQIVEQLEQQVASLIVKSDRVDEIEAKLGELSQRFEGQNDKFVEQYVAAINQQLQQLQPKFEYELVCGRKKSHDILLKALEECEDRLILVCPWVSRYVIKDKVRLGLETLLRNHRSVDIGWGKLDEVKNAQADRERLIRDNEWWKYNAIPDLESLKRLEGAKLQLKLLGTHEKYLVCDQKFAMLGSHNFLTSGSNSQEREVGIYTTDLNIINALTGRFEESIELGHFKPYKLSAAR